MDSVGLGGLAGRVGLDGLAGRVGWTPGGLALGRIKSRVRELFIFGLDGDVVESKKEKERRKRKVNANLPDFRDIRILSHYKFKSTCRKENPFRFENMRSHHLSATLRILQTLSSVTNNRENTKNNKQPPSYCRMSK